MKFKHGIASALVMLALGTQGLLAQERPEGPPDPATMAQHRVKRLTNFLSLTPQQQEQALTIFTNAATSQSSVHESMKAAHDSLRAAIKNNDAAGINSAATTIGNLTAQIMATEAKANAALYAILTPDQQTKLNQMEAEGPHMRMGGPGPMGFEHP